MSCYLQATLPSSTSHTSPYLRSCKTSHKPCLVIETRNTTAADGIHAFGALVPCRGDKTTSPPPCNMPAASHFQPTTFTPPTHTIDIPPSPRIDSFSSSPLPICICVCMLHVRRGLRVPVDKSLERHRIRTTGNKHLTDSPFAGIMPTAPKRTSSDNFRHQHASRYRELLLHAVACGDACLNLGLVSNL